MPVDWRRANVAPGFKKSKKEDPGNGKPVSLNCIPGKVREQLVLEAISKYLTDKKAIRNSPHGFKRGNRQPKHLV